MFQKFCIFISRLTKIPEQFIRFLIIGSINTGFAYGLYALFVFMGCHYAVAVFLSTVIGICFSFKTLGTLVFDNPDNRLILKFFSVYAICYFVNVGILKLLTGLGLENLYVAGLISSFLVALVSFFLNKFVVFRRT